MGQNDCTALIQYVITPQSHRPRATPRLTFFSLPREVRDEVYDLVLVSRSPIIVWKGNWMVEYLNQPYQWDGPPPRPCARVRWRLVDHDATAASLRSLNLNLFFCNKILSQEAATVFYKDNTFSFLGDHNWDPIVAWLRDIGTVNRNSITEIEINGRRPDPVWQCSDGQRIRAPGGFTMEEIYPRHPLLQTSDKPFKCGLVDNINPAMEDVFKLLGRRLTQQKVTFIMQLDSIYPGAGANPMADDCCPDRRWYSMELANLAEKFVELHTQKEGLVEVLWKGRKYRSEIPVERELAELIGWKMTVLPVEEDDACFWPNFLIPGGVAKYILRRKKLLEPLMAQDPSPFS